MDLRSSSSPLIYSHFLNCSSVSHRVLKHLGSLCVVNYYLLHDDFTNMIPGQNVSFIGAQFSVHAKSTFHNVWFSAISFNCSPSYSWGERGTTSIPIGIPVIDAEFRRLRLDLLSWLVWMSERQQRCLLRPPCTDTVHTCSLNGR